MTMLTFLMKKWILWDEEILWSDLWPLQSWKEIHRHASRLLQH